VGLDAHADSCNSLASKEEKRSDLSKFAGNLGRKNAARDFEGERGKKGPRTVHMSFITLSVLVPQTTLTKGSTSSRGANKYGVQFDR